MKTIKFLALSFIIGLFVSGTAGYTQTVQFDLYASVNGVKAYCLERNISGEWIYHVTYHIDKKTGKMDNFHWNVKHYDIWDTETGDRYIMVDTGNDNYGILWVFFNYIKSITGINYNVEDEWLPMPEVLPDEGTTNSMSFKFIAPHGEVLKMSAMWQVHINANGVPTVDFYKEVIDCN